MRVRSGSQSPIRFYQIDHSLIRILRIVQQTIPRTIVGRRNSLKWWILINDECMRNEKCMWNRRDHAARTDTDTEYQTNEWWHLQIWMKPVNDLGLDNPKTKEKSISLFSWTICVRVCSKIAQTAKCESCRSNLQMIRRNIETCNKRNVHWTFYVVLRL